MPVNMHMKRLLTGIRRRFVDLLNLDVLGEKYKVLAINYVFLMVDATLESVFVNTLLYRIDSGIELVIYYRCVTFIASAVFMHLAAYVAQKTSPIFVVKLGALLHLFMYVLLFFGLERMDVLMYLVAAFAGAGGAFYWAGHNVLVVNYTSRHHRDVGIAVLGVIQGIMSLCVPVISGFVISLLPEISGYRVMFGVGAVCVGVQIWIQTKLHPVVSKEAKSEIRLALKLIWRKMSYKLMLTYEMMRGMRDGAFAFILNMVLFEIITNESLVGINTFLTGALAITGSWAYGKLVNASNRARYTILATTILLGSCAALFAVMNAAMVMLFAVINSFFALFILYSCNNTTFDVISQNETTRKCMGEMLAFREGAMCIGRVAGIMLVLFFPHTQKGYVQSMCILTLSQYVVAIFMKITEKTINRKQLKAQREVDMSST